MTFLLTAVAMVAFAANSLLCRLALAENTIDAAGFTFIRILSGFLMLALIAGVKGRFKHATVSGSWPAAAALFIYMAGFSFAYHNLTTATGALLLFGAVQITMVGYGIWHGERLKGMQYAGLFIAVAGIIFLLLPGIGKPTFTGATSMLLAGVGWGAYSLKGRKTASPLIATTGNFLRAIPLSVLFVVFTLSDMRLTSEGVVAAVTSGSLASGLGYAIWYAVLPKLRAIVAASAQLSVPVLAAFAGSLILDESLTLGLITSSLITLGGIALIINFGK